MIDRLIKFLNEDDVVYERNFFETDDGIAGLGEEPFVSIITYIPAKAKKAHVFMIHIII